MKVTKEMINPGWTVDISSNQQNIKDKLPEIKGFDFDLTKNKNPKSNQSINSNENSYQTDIDYQKLLKSFKNTGLQASKLHKAIEITRNMLKWRGPEGERTKIFLGYTFNAISSGLREMIKFLAKEKLIDVIVTSSGGISEDLIKCQEAHRLASFRENDQFLAKQGLHRIGNILSTEQTEKDLETKIFPILDYMWEQQSQNGKVYTPSEAIKLFAERLSNPDSVYYWCAKNNIPVYCPGFSDGIFGEIFLSYFIKTKRIVKIDLVMDIRKVNMEALTAKKTGVIILGGGVIKHHILNANLMRNGAHFAVYINTAHLYDASDAGANTSEALSWGKLALDSQHVKISADFSLVFPFLISEVFYPEAINRRNQNKSNETQEFESLNN